MTALRNLICACCGARVIGRQWHNRDTGYGLCSSCAAWLNSIGVSDKEVEQNYGRAGEHYNVGTGVQS